MNNQNPNQGAPTLVFAKCTNCGAEMQVNAAQECVVCPSCGQPFVTAKGISHYNTQHGIGAAAFVPQQEPPKKRRTWLWVLGWIFCFPIPLTILMMRNKTMNPKAKYGIIAAGWILYLVLMLGSRASGNRSTTPPVSEPETQIVTNAPEEKPVTEPIPAATETPETKMPETEAPVTEPEESKPAEPSAGEIQQAVQNGDYSLVSPEFKATMDAYEAFYDDYLAFMNKYTSGEGDMMSMMNDYMTMISDMEEWSKKIDAIDESTLSPADDAYYLLVTLRIEKKLLGAV